MQETWVQFLGQEDPLEQEMSTHSSTLDWEVPWTEKPGGLQSMASQRVGHDGANEDVSTHNTKIIHQHVQSIILLQEDFQPAQLTTVSNYLKTHYKGEGLILDLRICYGYDHISDLNMDRIIKSGIW